MTDHKPRSSRKQHPRTPLWTHGQIPRRWVFLSDNDKPLFHLLVSRAEIRKVEACATLLGLPFTNTIIVLLESGLEAAKGRTCPKTFFSEGPSGSNSLGE